MTKYLVLMTLNYISLALSFKILLEFQKAPFGCLSLNVPSTSLTSFLMVIEDVSKLFAEYKLHILLQISLLWW